MVYSKIFLVFFFLQTIIYAQTHNIEKVQLQLQWKYQFQFAGFIMAKELGYYKDVGLDVEILEYNNTNSIKDLEDGKIDYAINNSLLAYHNKKLNNVTLLATYFQRSPLIIITQPEIKSVLDLKNKKVMISENNRYNSSLSILLDYFNINGQNTTFINPSFNLEDFINRKVDAFTGFRSNELYELNQRKIPYNIIDPVEYGFSTNAINLFASHQKVKNNPQQIKNFLQATKKGWVYALNNIDEVAKLIHEKYQPNKSIEHLVYEGKVTKEMMLINLYEIGEINREFVLKTYAQLIKSSKLTQDQDSDYLMFEDEKKNTWDLIVDLLRIIVGQINETVVITTILFIFTILILKQFWSYRIQDEINKQSLIQEKLEQSEERYKTLFKSNLAVQLFIDPQTNRIIDCNKSAEEFYGYSYEELTNMYVTDINIMTQEDINQEIQKALQLHKNNFHFKHKLANGEIKDVEVSSGPLQIEGKTYLYSMIFDITEQKKLEAYQQNIQERLVLAMEGSYDGLWDWNLKTNEVYYSPRWKEILGYKDNEIENDFNVWKDLVHNDDLQNAMEEINNLINSSDKDLKFNMKFRMLHKDGHYVPILSRAKKILNENGELIRLVGTHIDLTELVAMEDAYKEERDRSQLYLDTAEVLLVALDTQGRVTMLNRKGEELLGYKEEEVLGKAWFEIGVLPREIEENIHQFFNNLIFMKELPKKSVEHSLLDKNGKEVVVSFRNALLFDKEHNISGVLSSGTDITEKIRVEKEFQLQKEQLFKSEKMAAMGSMIGNIAHQWRQPLSAITVASSGIQVQHELGMLNEDKLNQACEIINKNAQYLSQTIDDFRNFIKGDREKKTFNLKANIESFMGLVEGTIKSNNLNMILNLEDNILVTAYPNELIQCIMNIFNNSKDALKVIEEDDRYIFIDTYSKDNNVVIEMKDSGGGIPDEVISHIFEPYFTTKHQSQGTGLGLHMSYKIIVDGFGGTLNATNTTFEWENKQLKGVITTIEFPLIVEK